MQQTTTDEIKPGRYRHFKGNEYEVLYIARHSETLEPMVVYRTLYGEGGIWVRPTSMWNETVERDGKVFKRFEYIQTYDGLSIVSREWENEIFHFKISVNV